MSCWSSYGELHTPSSYSFRCFLDLDLLFVWIRNRGENKAALEVARREQVPTDGPKYAVYGIDEDTLWDKIESMDGWWKDTTWKRLVLRELPDA